MKLIRQISLWNNSGNSDKVYEIDICETMPGKYVVNFRYGKRNTTLKDGTKTAMPVSLTEAEKIFDKLVAEKKKGDYRETGGLRSEDIAQPAPARSSSPDGIIGIKEYVLQCLRRAVSSPGQADPKWPLSRIVWRAGELKIAAATELIIPLLDSPDNLLQYSACWALGRCGDTKAIDALKGAFQKAGSGSALQRIALAALLSLQQKNGDADSIYNDIVKQFPEPVVSMLQEGNGTALIQWLQERVGDTSANLSKVTEYLYLLSGKYPAAKEAVFGWVSCQTPAPGIFHALRHLFKLAEFKEDTALFALLTYKFEKTKGLFRFNRYYHSSGVYFDNVWIKNAREEIKKENTRIAYPQSTRSYLLRRVWRTLRTYGQDGEEDYARFAFNILLQYTDESDRQAPVTRTQTYYNWNSSARRYDITTSSRHYGSHAGSDVLNHILYHNSRKFFLSRNAKAWQQHPDIEIGESEREEAFPEIWDRYPQALIELLIASRTEAVHVFAIKALKSRTDLNELFDLDVLKRVLSSSFAVTTKFALQMVIKRYDAANPDLELLSLLLQHPVLEARQLAVEWIEAQLTYFATNTFIITEAIVNPYEDVFEKVNTWLFSGKISSPHLDELAVKSIAMLIDLKAENTLSEISAEHAARLITDYMLPMLANINIGIVDDMLHSTVNSVQILGSVLAIRHSIPAEQFPEPLLAYMIQCSNPQVRKAGIQLFGRLPQTTLLQQPELICAFCVSPYGEIREAIRPVVASLNTGDAVFGQKLLNDLLPWMHRKETYEGLHQDLYLLLTTSLSGQLSAIDTEETLSFVYSRHVPVQLLGVYLLNHVIDGSGFTIRQVIRMANHENKGVREYSWNFYPANISRITSEASEALRILDAKWDDSRRFGCDFFRTHFTEQEWTPDLLVSICDSTRPDIQSFGREMITKYFKEENGEQYLLQLSQHPAPTVQQFTTHYLEQFAANRPDNIDKLEPYFITVLSQVNKSGVAKKRIFSFLRDEALKDHSVATIVARVIARQSATMAVADKAACIGVMRDIQEHYPDIELPLKVKEPVVY